MPMPRTMQAADFGDDLIHYREDGDENGAPVVFANSLGTDLRLWDSVLPLLPRGLRIIRYDKRGHGLSSCPPAPYGMDQLVADAERLLDRLGVRDCLFVGLSIGGMIAQGLASKRPNLVRAMTLSNTGARIGTREMWQDRIDAVGSGGVESLADAVMERWFSAEFRSGPELAVWRRMLVRTPAEGYAGCSAAIQGADFRDSTAALTLPTLAIAGDEDGSTPPDLVRETAGLVPGSRFCLIEGAGHLPCVEKPEAFAAVLGEFIEETGHAGEASASLRRRKLAREGEGASRIPAGLQAESGSESAVGRYARGMETRRRVLGDAHVDRAEAGKTAFDEPFQTLITEYAWGTLWSDDAIAPRERSMLTIALLAALGNHEEMAMHVRATRNTGATKEDVMQALLHAAVYAGVPRANHAIRIAKEVYAEMEDGNAQRTA